jgi:hypothetical protein
MRIAQFRARNNKKTEKQNKLGPVLNYVNITKAYEPTEFRLHVLLNSAVDRVVWRALISGLFILEVLPRGFYWIAVRLAS